jgi:hypothetical protein
VRLDLSRQSLVPLLGALALITPAAASGERRLHERIDDPGRDDGPLVDQPADGQNPAALRVGSVEIPEPGHSSRLAPGERPFVASPEGPAGLGRDASWRPDLETDVFPPDLQYTETFQPSVSPYKRISSLDIVGPGYELGVADRRLREVPVGGAALPDRELFWGSVVVSLSPGRPVPIPSVAPGARILSARTEPRTAIRFLRDGADNDYVVGDVAGQVRIVFVTDAPASYFGGPVPAAASARDIPAGLRPVLPAAIARTALSVAGRLGLEPGVPVGRNLARLVAYLRAFRAEPLDAPRGADPYEALALGRRGVCRHRAFVFVVTAQALGIPARFVTNEAHAFAEAYLPSSGWRRIDLGGAGPLASPSEGVIPHQPREQDPFPWPEGRQRSVAGPPAGLVGPSRSASPAGTAPTRAIDGGVREGAGDPRRVAEAGQEPGGRDPGEASPSGDPAPPEPPPVSGEVVLEQHTPLVLRGETLHVSGHVEHLSSPPDGTRVVIWLRRPDGSDAAQLGSVALDGAGRFASSLVVPGDLPPGDYSVAATVAVR